MIFCTSGTFLACIHPLMPGFHTMVSDVSDLALANVASSSSENPPATALLTRT